MMTEEAKMKFKTRHLKNSGGVHVQWILIQEAPYVNNDSMPITVEANITAQT
jgi:hypothetical protein